MVVKKNHISPQYFRKGEICVSILEIKSPVHFIVKESPDINTSSDAKKFIEAEEMMQKYYHSIEAEFFQLPLKDSIVVVQHKNKYYRAQVCSILNIAEGHLIKVYLLDYGKECSVPRQSLFEIHPDFLHHPFQAVNFKLLDVEPISLVLSSQDLSLDHGPVSTWDVSAIAFIENLQKVMNSAHIKIQGMGENFLFGSLYLTFNNQEVKCINEELIQERFARRKKDFLSGVTELNSVLPDIKKHDSIQHPGVFSEEDSCKRLSSQEHSSTPTSSQKPESLGMLDSPPTTASLSPSSLSKPNDSINKLKKLKMLQKKSPGGAPIGTPLSPPIADMGASKMPTKGISVDNTTVNENKLNTPENTILNVTPNKAEISGKSQLQRLMKYHNKKKSPPHAQKAPDSSTPLNNQTLPEVSCTGPPSPLVQTSSGRFPGSVIDGISPITGDRSDALSSGSCSLSLKEETNSLNVAFMNSTQAKDVQKLSELSINEMQNSNKENSIKASPPKPTSTKFRNLKDLYKKRNSLPSKSEGNIQNNFRPCESDQKPEVLNKGEMPIGLGESDSEPPMPIFEDGLNEGFSDIEDMGDLLHCVLNPESKAMIDSPDSSRQSSAASNDSSEEYQQINDIDFSDKSLWEKQKVPALCIGEAVPSPLLSTGEASFPPALHKTLERLNFHGPSCIQSVVWPAAERRRCLAAIGPPHSGKTVAYLLPIVANFMSSIAYAELPQASGPIAIILCSSWRKVQAVYDLFRTFLSGFKCKILTFFADGRSKRKNITALMEGCDVLISVPYCLVDFFEDRVLCLKRCCHFILDDGSTLLSHNRKELNQIMPAFARGIGLRTSVPVTLQVLICAERWRKDVASFVDKFMHTPLLLFTSFLEAAVYAKVPIHAHICDIDDKKRKLLGILEKAKKTIICTNSSYTASEIHNFLKCENVRSFLVNEEMEHYISDGVIQDWKSVRSTATPHCLVVTDTAFTHMHISDANYLIHYDVPQISRLQFGNRFSCIAEHFTSPNGTPDCVCHVLLSEDCAVQAPSLVKLIERSGIVVGLELKELAKKQNTMKKPISIPLCHYMKAFGSCTLPTCQQRHHIDPIADKPNAVPCEGDVHIHVAHICDASHFYGRLMRYLSPDVAKPTSMSATYAKVGFDLKKLYSLECNQRKVEDPTVGACYVLQEDNAVFYRVKVLSVIPASQGHCKKVKLLFLDEGWVQISDNFQLLEYIEDDQFPPPLAMEVYLCGVRTPDTSSDWNPQSSRYISNLIKGKDIHGKIVLCLGETLWLHPVVIREKQMYTNDYLNVVAVDKSLKNAGYAIDNKSHLPLLFKACGNDITLPKEIKTATDNLNIEEEEIPQQFSYAFLDLNVCEDVFVSNVVSPHEFHVQRAKFVECLDDLSDKIQEKVKSNTLEKCKALQNGMHCIALFQEDNRYYRAVITEVIAESDDAQVFFVDFGDFGRVSKDSTYILPPELTLLPFQAIKCELNGICAPHGGWTDQAGDTLYNLTRNEDGDMKILPMIAYKKSQQFGIGNHYVVDLWNSEKTVSEQLLEAGLVNSSEKLVLIDTPAEEIKQEMFDDLPDGYIASSDEDLDEEDKIIHAKFFAEIAKLMYGPDALEAQTDSDNLEVSTDSANSEAPTDSRVTDVTNLEDSGKTESTPAKKVEKLEVIKTTKRSPFQAMQKFLNHQKNEPKRAKPFITWWNTVQHVNILIHLRDIEIYELEVKEDRFIFSTSLGGMDYHTEEELFSKVHSDEPITSCKVEGLSIILKKQVSELWPHLIKNKSFHIKYDFDHIDESDSDGKPEEERPIIENPDESMVAHYDSEDDMSSDDNDDERYVQPWKRLAQYRDPFDPLD